MTLSEHCSSCEKYIKAYLKNGPEGFDQKRMEKGFWASVKEVNDEQWLLNNIFNVEEAIKMRMPAIWTRTLLGMGPGGPATHRAHLYFLSGHVLAYELSQCPA